VRQKERNLTTVSEAKEKNYLATGLPLDFTDFKKGKLLSFS